MPAETYFSDIRPLIEKSIYDLDLLLNDNDRKKKISEHVDVVLLEFISSGLRIIHSSYLDFDRLAQFNIEILGSDFRAFFSMDSNVYGDLREQIFIIFLLRFIIEAEISGIRPSNSEYIHRVIQYIRSARESFTPRNFVMFDYATNTMHIAIARHLYTSEGISVIKSYIEASKNAELLKRDLKDQIDTQLARVDILKEALESHKSEFNFVGLFQAFSNILNKKVWQRRWTLLSLVLLAFASLLPALTFFFTFILNSTFKVEHKDDLIFIALSSTSWLFVFLYFFRVVLTNYKSVRSEIGQIELRMSLCQFIQDYAKFSSDIKVKDPAALERFESIIFSSIVQDPEKIPSTFDGLDSITQIVKALKS